MVMGRQPRASMIAVRMVRKLVKALVLMMIMIIMMMMMMIVTW